MATITSQINSAEVRGVQEQFERWRLGRQRRERIPPKLWGLAVQLCEAYSIHQIAQRLRLNYTALKVQVATRLKPRLHKVAAAVKPAFVEWDLPAGMAPGHSSAVARRSPTGRRPSAGSLGGRLATTRTPVVEYVVEATPRILVRGASPLEVAALVRALQTDGGGGR